MLRAPVTAASFLLSLLLTLWVIPVWALDRLAQSQAAGGTQAFWLAAAPLASLPVLLIGTWLISRRRPFSEVAQGTFTGVLCGTLLTAMGLLYFTLFD